MIGKLENLEKGLDVDEDMKIHFKRIMVDPDILYHLLILQILEKQCFPSLIGPIDNPYLSYPINDDVIESVKAKEDMAAKI